MLKAPGCTDQQDLRQVVLAGVLLAPLLDRSKIDELADNLSFETLRELMSLCLTHTVAHAAILCDGDLEAISREAHAIVSAAGNLGLDRLSVQARLLEQACRSGETDCVAVLIGEVKVTAKATEAELKAWLAAAALKQKAIA